MSRKKRCEVIEHVKEAVKGGLKSLAKRLATENRNTALQPEIPDQSTGNVSAVTNSDGGKKKRGRPPGSPTNNTASDIRLYENFKAAKRETGVTKKDFLRGKGLDDSNLSAMERGRKAISKSGRNSTRS